mgnify:FL=1
MAEKNSKPIDLASSSGFFSVMAEKNSKPIDPKNIEVETEGPSSILDDIYDVAYDIFPEATEGFQKKVSNMLEKVVNYIDGIAPSWETGCDRIYNKLMNFLDGAEESTIKAIDKVQHSPLGKVIDTRYKRNHPDED